MIKTTGAVGAAKAAGVAAGAYQSIDEALGEIRVLETFTADKDTGLYQQGFEQWKSDLEKILADH